MRQWGNVKYISAVLDHSWWMLWNAFFVWCCDGEYRFKVEVTMTSRECWFKQLTSYKNPVLQKDIEVWMRFSLKENVIFNVLVIHSWSSVMNFISSYLCVLVVNINLFNAQSSEVMAKSLSGSSCLSCLYLFILIMNYLLIKFLYAHLTKQSNNKKQKKPRNIKYINPD